jgi:type IV secretion system protein VirB5
MGLLDSLPFSSSPGDSSSSNGVASATASVGDNPSRSSGEESIPNPLLDQGVNPDGALETERRQKVFFVLVTGVLAVAVIVLALSNVWLSTSTRVEPFFVAVDSETSEVVDARPVSMTKNLSEDMVRYRLEQVLRGLRTVYSDRRATANLYSEAWRYILPDSKADSWLRDYLSEQGNENPVQLVGEQQRTITAFEIQKIEGTRTWKIDWAEKHVNQRNDVREVIFSGSMSTARVDLNDVAALEMNPLGLFIDGISWSKTKTKLLKVKGETVDSAE